MSLDWQNLLYGPIYDSLGIDASLVTSAGATVSISAIDATTGVSLTDRVGVESIRPVAYVRSSKLSGQSVAVSDLPEGQLTLNGATWRIKAARQRPGPAGESAGEVMLILLSEGT